MQLLFYLICLLFIVDISSAYFVYMNILEIIEKGDNILGCQFHPEFKSRPDKPHPLFKLFINNAKKYFNEVD